MGPQNDRDHVVTGGFDKSCARETMGTRAVEEGMVIVSQRCWESRQPHTEERSRTPNSHQTHG